MKTKTVFVNSVFVRVCTVQLRVTLDWTRCSHDETTPASQMQDSGRRDVNDEDSVEKKTRDTLKSHREGVERICAPFIENNTEEVMSLSVR